jgi:hypothetical protein
MATTSRARKTTAAKEAAAAAETTETTEAAEITVESTAETTAATESPKAPEAAPLEPPTVHAAPEPPAGTGYVAPTEVIPDDIAEVILDDATKAPPADIDAVFEPVTPYGSTLICRVRLIERTFLGPHRNPVERLLQPKGAHVSESIAARIHERLVAQAAKIEAEK